MGAPAKGRALRTIRGIDIMLITECGPGCYLLPRCFLKCRPTGRRALFQHRHSGFFSSFRSDKTLATRWQCCVLFTREKKKVKGHSGRLFTQHHQTRSCCLVCLSLCLTLLWPRGLQPARLLCPWGSPGKNTGVGCHFLLQGIFPTQRWNLHLLH